MLISFIEGFKVAIRSKRMITIIYLTTLLLGLLIAIPFFGETKANLSSKLLLNDLLEGFDYTAYSDIKHNFGEIINPFISLIKWLGIGYLLFSIFFSGGILGTFIKNENDFSLKSFFYYCGKYFKRFSKLSIYIFILQLTLFIILTIPYVLIITSIVDTVENEATLVYTTLIYIELFIVFFCLFSLVADYARIIIVKDGSYKVIRSIWQSIKFVAKNLKSILLYILTFGFPVALFVTYLFLESSIGMVSISTIFLMIIIQQAYVWLRVLGKVWIFASSVSFYDRKSITLLEKKDSENEFVTENELELETT